VAASILPVENNIVESLEVSGVGFFRCLERLVSEDIQNSGRDAHGVLKHKVLDSFSAGRS